MKTKTKSLPKHFHTMKTSIYNHLCCFGRFYKQHRKIFMGAKIVALIVVLTIVFSARNGNNMIFKHGVIPTYAEDLCGNGICEYITESCTLTSNNCSKILDLTGCTTVPGCSITTNDVYTCSGTTRSCTALSTAKDCALGKCYWDTTGSSCSDINPNSGLPETNQSCANLSSKESCNWASAVASGDCTWIVTGTNNICMGYVSQPTDETGCTNLNTILIPIGRATTRRPTYIETNLSCPVDCNVLCGNGILEGVEQCDDNNTINNDGCNDQCTLEVPYCELAYQYNSFTVHVYNTRTEVLSIDYDDSYTYSFSGLIGTNPIGTYFGIGIHTYTNNGIYHPIVTVKNISGEIYGSCTVTVVVGDTPGAICGNGVSEPGEICDSGMKNGDYGYCNGNCGGYVGCGDGILQGDHGEECDDGNANNNDGCSSICWREPQCDLNITGTIRETPFTGYFTYWVPNTTKIDYMAYDSTTTGIIDIGINSFTHLYTTGFSGYTPTLYVSSITHTEVTSSCKSNYNVCSPRSIKNCGSDELGNRGFQCKDIPQSECFFLIQLYEATNGSGRDNTDGRLENPNACEWDGISCTQEISGQRYLQTINLSNNNLDGQLPSMLDLILPYIFPIQEIGFSKPWKTDTEGNISLQIDTLNSGADLVGLLPFQHLETVDLSENNLWGTIPMGYFSLVFSKHLDFSNNKFTSLFGTEPLVSLTSLLQLPGMNEFMEKGYAAGYGTAIDLGMDIANNISFVPTKGFWYYTTLSFFTQRFDLDHFAYNILRQKKMYPESHKGARWDTVMATIRAELALNPYLGTYYSLPTSTKDVWNTLYNYYTNNITSSTGFFDIITRIMFGIDDGTHMGNFSLTKDAETGTGGSVTEYSSDTFGDIGKGIIISILGGSSISGSKLNINMSGDLVVWGFSGGETINTPINTVIENTLALITSIFNFGFGGINRLETANLSHNTISSLPEYLPINSCIQELNLSYNNLAGPALPYISYFGYSEGPIIEAGIVPGVKFSTAPGGTTTGLFKYYSGDDYSNMLAETINSQAKYFYDHGYITTGSYSEFILSDVDIVDDLFYRFFLRIPFTSDFSGLDLNFSSRHATANISNHGDFYTVTTLADNPRPITNTVFGKNCIQNDDSNIICGTGAIPLPTRTGQYIGVIFTESNIFHGVICAYTGQSWTFNNQTMNFDPYNVCSSLGMLSGKRYDVKVSKLSVPSIICAHSGNTTITLDFSHNQLDGDLPEIVTTNSTDFAELSGKQFTRGPLWTFMQDDSPIDVVVKLNDNNFNDTRTNAGTRPLSRDTHTEGDIQNNCLVWPTTFESTYLEDSRTKRENQKSCNAATPPTTAGPGGTPRLTKDVCLDGDFSPSYYDHICVGTSHTTIPKNCTTILDTPELRDAYLYALDHQLITSSTINSCSFYDKITRRDLAKTLDAYMKNVVGVTPIPERGCLFDDIANESLSTKSAIHMVCDFGIMGLEKDGKTPKKSFSPNDFLTRAEFGTVLSRLLYDGTYNPSVDSPYKRYELHLKALSDRGIAKNVITPETIETKGYVLIMLQRTDTLVISALRNKQSNPSLGNKTLNNISAMLKNLFIKKTATETGTTTGLPTTLTTGTNNSGGIITGLQLPTNGTGISTGLQEKTVGNITTMLKNLFIK